MKPEEADDEVSQRHCAYSSERIVDVGRSKQTQNELDRVSGVTEAELDHVRETAAKTEQVESTFRTSLHRSLDHYCLLVCFIHQSTSRKRYNFTRKAQFKKMIKQPCGLNGQHRAMPLTCINQSINHGILEWSK